MEWTVASCLTCQTKFRFTGAEELLVRDLHFNDYNVPCKTPGCTGVLGYMSYAPEAPVVG